MEPENGGTYTQTNTVRMSTVITPLAHAHRALILSFMGVHPYQPEKPTDILHAINGGVSVHKVILHLL